MCTTSEQNEINEWWLQGSTCFTSKNCKSIKNCMIYQSPSSDSVFSQAALVAGASVIGNAANSLNDVLSQTGLSYQDIAQPAKHDLYGETTLGCRSLIPIKIMDHWSSLMIPLMIYSVGSLIPLIPLIIDHLWSQTMSRPKNLLGHHTDELWRFSMSSRASCKSSSRAKKMKNMGRFKKKQTYHEI